MVQRRIVRDLAAEGLSYDSQQPLPAISATIKSGDDAIRRIGDFLAGYSLEATRPKANDVEALKASAPKGLRIYLSAVAGKPIEEVVAHAKAIRAAGFEPVPHLAARKFASREALADLLAGLKSEASVRHVLVIAGDSDAARGPFASSIEVIESGLLQRNGITGIGIGGHPDGHPRIPSEGLDLALANKIEAAQQSGLSVEIVTQFCFDPQTIIRWIERLRDLGVRKSRAHRHGRAGGRRDPASLCRALRREGVGVGRGAPRRAGEASVRRRHAGRDHPRAGRGRQQRRASATSPRIFFPSAASTPPRAGPRRPPPGRIALDPKDGFAVASALLFLDAASSKADVMTGIAQPERRRC